MYSWFFDYNFQASISLFRLVIEGDGLKEGTVGQPILFTLDGSKAGPGQLSCRCRSPTGTMTYVYITDNKVTVIIIIVYPKIN